MKKFFLYLHIIMFFNWLIYMMVAFIHIPDTLAFNIWGLSALTCLLIQIASIIVDALKDEGIAD